MKIASLHDGESGSPVNLIRLVRQLLAILREERLIVFVAIGAGVLSSVAEGVGISFFIPFLQLMVDGTGGEAPASGFQGALHRLFSGFPTDDRLLIVGGFILGSLCIKAALGYAYGALFALLDARFGHKLRSDVFGALLRVKYAFLERNERGDLFNTLSTETWRTCDALKTVVWGVITLFTTAVYVAILLLISWPLTLLVGAAMLAISMLVRVLRRPVERLGVMSRRANSSLAARMLESFEAMKTIRAFGREAYETDRFAEPSLRVSRVFFRLSLISGALGPIYEVLTASVLVALLVFSSGSADLATLLVFTFVLYRLQPKIQALDETRLGLAALAPAVEAVTEVLNLPPENFLASGDVLHADMLDGISLNNVSFHYAPEWGDVLEEINLVIPKGKTTAIVGRSGSGKSTLINLLLRLYDPTSGNILIDDVPLSSLNLESWRQRVGLVSQDVHIFNASIWDNIAYGRLDASDEEVSEAAKLADINSFIMGLEDGYETLLGSGATSLSGGQRQRVALARALVRNPRLLIMDEATNAVDAISERLINESLDRLRDGRTIIVVAHRMSTIERADQIVVLDGGRVRDQGTRDELLARDDLFAELNRSEYYAEVLR